MPFFNVVYDCGSHKNNSSYLAKQVNCFKNNVDLLFVSQFHENHINGIINLLGNNERQCIVVFPGICQRRT